MPWILTKKWCDPLVEFETIRVLDINNCLLGEKVRPVIKHPSEVTESMPILEVMVNKTSGLGTTILTCWIITISGL